MKKNIGNIIKYLLSFALAGVLVYFAFRKIDFGEFMKGLAGTRWAYVALFFLAALLAVVFREERWRAMLLPLQPGVKRIDAWDAANVGNVTNVVLPGAGEFVRCAYISSRSGISYDKALGTVVCERAWDVLAVLLLFVGALVLGWGRFGGFVEEEIIGKISPGGGPALWWTGAAVLVALAVFVWAIFRFRKENGFFAKAAGAIKGLGQGFVSFALMKHKWVFLLLTLGIWAMYVLMSWAILKAVPALSGCGMMDALFLSAAGNVASVIPVPGGVGAYHYLLALSLQTLYGATWDTGILFATLSHESHAILIIVLGLASYLRLTLHKKQSSAS